MHKEITVVCGQRLSMKEKAKKKKRVPSNFISFLCQDPSAQVNNRLLIISSTKLFARLF